MDKKDFTVENHGDVSIITANNDTNFKLLENFDMVKWGDNSVIVLDEEKKNEIMKSISEFEIEESDAETSLEEELKYFAEEDSKDDDDEDNGDDDDKTDDKEDDKKKNDVDVKESIKLSEKDLNIMVESMGIDKKDAKKVQTIFESYVSLKVNQIKKSIEEFYESKFDEAVEANSNEITDKVDSYLESVVQEWYQENDVEIEKDFKNNILESLHEDFTKLQKKYNFYVAEDKVDLYAEITNEHEELKTMYDAILAENKEFKTTIEESAKQKIIDDCSETMSDVSKDKFIKMTEGISYTDMNSYGEKVAIIAESLFDVKLNKKLSSELKEEHNVDENGIQLEIPAKAKKNSYVDYMKQRSLTA